MRAVHLSPGTTEIEEHVLFLLRANRKLTFSSLADAMPECKWHDLLHVLNQLRQRRQVELAPLQWDYEVTLVTA